MNKEVKKTLYIYFKEDMKEMSKNYVEKNFTRIEKLCKKLNISCTRTCTMTTNGIVVAGDEDGLVFVISANPTMIAAGLFNFTAPAVGINNPAYLSIKQIELIILGAVQ